MDFEFFFLLGTIIITFYMAWNVGANDVANAMGTSVGSKVLTIKQAVIIAAIFEFAGAVLVGSHVSDTIRQGIVNPNIFVNSPDLLIIGMFSALTAAALWLHLATFFGMPVSTTHSIVGAVIGFGLIHAGAGAINWKITIEIILSWFISPLFGGILAYMMFSYINRKVLNVDDAIPAAIKLAPKMIFLVIFILVLSFIYKGLKNLHLNLTFYNASLIAGAVALVSSIIASYFLKHLKNKGNVSEFDFVERIFKYLQILTACYIAFAHGANDVANAIGPAAAVFSTIQTYSVSVKDAIDVPFMLLILGGIGIVVGISTYGYKVIETIGKKITEMTPSRGFSATFGAATTVLVCSRLKLPVSTTHILVGAVVGVGLARGIGALNLNILKNIVSSWVITLPLSAGLSMLIFKVLCRIFIH